MHYGNIFEYLSLWSEVQFLNIQKSKKILNSQLPSIASVVVDSSSRDDMDINHEEEKEEAIETYILTRPD